MNISINWHDHLPDIQSVNPETIQSEIKAIIDANKKEQEELFNQKHFTWDNLMGPLDEMQDRLNKKWSIFSHLHSVLETPALRTAYNQTLPLITEYQSSLAQNEKLFAAIQSLAQSPIYNQFTPAQKKTIQNDLRDLKLSGVHLPKDQKEILAKLQKQLHQLMTLFSENLLDSTQSFHLPIESVEKLEGLPTQALQLAKARAEEKGEKGYLLTLDYPIYSACIRFLKDRELRKTLHQAYSTRASECGPDKGRFDNTTTMNELLKLRNEIANITGFANYADYSLATKMAKTSEVVLNFLKDLLNQSKPIAQKEYDTVVQFAQKIDGLNSLEPWDIAYYSEKLQESVFKFTQEDLRPYFPINKVLNGLFAIVEKLFGLKIKAEENISVWHTDVQFYSVYDANSNLRGGFYIDLYARPHKREGAWMDECRNRNYSLGRKQNPVAFLTCNFMPPVDNKPALLTHDEVLTLFHEFGHSLHHILTKVEVPSVAGINGVLWDAVEFPSQFMENFCWDKNTLSLISGHYQTNEPIPETLFKNMLAGKHFQTGMQMVRQLEFSLFDFLIHLNYDPSQKDFIQNTLDEVRRTTSVYQIPSYNRFQHSFSHIFAGSYAAGYYSYKWAEVLSADAFAFFEEKASSGSPLLNENLGLAFMKSILEVGGVPDPMDAYVHFRGRKPTIAALIKHYNLEATAEGS